MRKFFLILLCLCIWDCSLDDKGNPSSASVQLEKDSEISGLLHVNSTGAKVTLGTKNSEAKFNERPQMTAKFTYDFYIGQSEVTCKEFLELSENEDLIKTLKNYCVTDSLPVANINFYDAVLFANVRSKKESKDTAYSYTAATFSSDGHCSSLEGFSFHPEVDAYRLPTEAEWVLVAKQFWKPATAWTSENSDYAPHKVCSLAQNENDVCDMMGNLAEWVNDWFSLFKDATVTNYVGASDGGGSGERIIKGGSYRNAASAIQLYHRGDVYTVTSATRAAYVGFRLAYGTIPEPTWVSRKGSINNSVSTPLVSTSTMRKLTGSFKTKLVFRNDETGHLNYIDFSSATTSVTEIADTIEAYHPDISPDGNQVAFCTTFEGNKKKSDLYVYNLSTAALTKLDVESAAIPRWFITPEGDTTIIYVSNAGNSGDEDFFSRGTWQVSFTKGAFGTPRKLFNGSYHSGISSDYHLAVTGARVLRAREDLGDSIKDVIWYDNEQACNASLSKDGTKRTLFLDFVSKSGKEFVGEDYYEHQYVFIVDSTGKLIQSIKAPQGYSFDHTEWIVGGDYKKSNLIIATLRNDNGARKKVVLINTENETITDLVSGEELWHPALWSKPRNVAEGDFALDLDSAGIYYNETSRFPAYELRSKMESFWTEKDSITVVAFGSSRVLFGVDSRLIKSEKMLNFAYSGGDLYGTEFLFDNYVLNHMKNVKTIIIEFTPNMFWRTVTMDWSAIYEGHPGYRYDENHDFWVKGIPEDFIEAVKEGPTLVDKSSLNYIDEFALSPNTWGKATVDANIKYMFFEDVLPQENYQRFKDIVERANKAGIKVIALIVPVNPGYKKTESFGLYGPTNDVAKQIIDEASKLDIIIMDEYKWGNHDYTNEMAHDADHLSVLGAAQLSARVDSMLQTLK